MTLCKGDSQWYCVWSELLQCLVFMGGHHLQQICRPPEEKNLASSYGEKADVKAPQDKFHLAEWSALCDLVKEFQNGF